jgi:hypothetical protein
MATYNRALDLMALAAYEAKKGNVVNAATLLQRAASDPSLSHALRMVEATNDYAAKVEAKAKVTARRQVRAQEGHEDIEKHANEHRRVERGLKDEVNARDEHRRADGEFANYEDTDEDTMDLLNAEEPNELEDEDDDAVDEAELAEEDEELEARAMASAKQFAKALAAVIKKQR